MSYNPQNPNGQATSANSTPVVIASDQTAVPVSVGGTLSATDNLTQIGGTTIVTAGVNGTLATGGNQAAGSNISTNTNPLLLAGSDYAGTPKLQTVKVDASGNLSITANGLALDSSVNGLLLSQASATSGQKGPLIQGAVTSAAPTYTTAQTSPLSLDTSGNLRTVISGGVSLSASSSNIGGVELIDAGGTNKLSINASGQASVLVSGGDLISGNQTTKITDGTNTANIGLGDASNGFVYIGSGRLTQSFSITSVTTTTAQDVGNYRWVSVQLSSQGTSSTVTFQSSNDNVNWLNFGLSSVGGTATSVVSTVTAPTLGLFHGPLPGRYFRLSISGISAGTTAGTILYSSTPAGMHTMGVAASIAGGINVTLLNGNSVNTGNGTTGTGTQRVTLSSDSTGQVALAAGTNAVGDVNLNPAQRGGWSVSPQNSLSSLATVSSAAGKFGGYMFMNTNSTPVYIQVYDTTGTPTLGTGMLFVIPLPANATSANGAGANLEITNGIAITSGIKIAAVSGGPTSNTVVSTALNGFIMYK